MKLSDESASICEWLWSSKWLLNSNAAHQVAVISCQLIALLALLLGRATVQAVHCLL
jgi:hypothetical protein